MSLQEWDPARRWREPPDDLWARIEADLEASSAEEIRPSRRRAGRRTGWQPVRWSLAAVLVALVLVVAFGGRAPTGSGVEAPVWAEITPSTPRTHVALEGPRGTRLLLSIDSATPPSDREGSQP